MGRGRSARRIILWVASAVAGNYIVTLLAAGGGLVLAVVVTFFAALPWYYAIPMFVGLLLMGFASVALVARAFIPASWYHQPSAAAFVADLRRSDQSPDWISPEQLRGYLQSIKKTMEEEGFESQPPVSSLPQQQSASVSIEEERAVLLKRGHYLLAQMTGAGRRWTSSLAGYPDALVFVRDGQELVSRTLPSRANPSLIARYETEEEARRAIEQTLDALANIGHDVAPW